MVDVVGSVEGGGEGMTIDKALRALRSEFSVSMMSAVRVEAACDFLRRDFGWCISLEGVGRLSQLLWIVEKRSGMAVGVFVEFVREVAVGCVSPWVLLRGLLHARSVEHVEAAVDDMLSLAEDSRLAIGDEVVGQLSRLLEEREELCRSADFLAKLGVLIRCGGGAPGEDAVEQLFMDSTDPRVRYVAALILDGEQQAAPLVSARRLFDTRSYDVLNKYLTFTRATHVDLLHLVPYPDQRAAAAESIWRTERLCGESLTREVIGVLGWEKVNYGLFASEQVGVSVSGSFPLVLRGDEVALLSGYEGCRQEFRRYVFVAHGGKPASENEEGGSDDSMSRFRLYNLTHASVLADIVDVAPLSVEKVERILACLDRIVEDFIILFSSQEPECELLPEVYGNLRSEVVEQMERSQGAPQLSAELTRLVQMFEDPSRLSDVQTIHGLKRYLHQKGLRLGFRLFESGRATNRTVDLVITSGDRVVCRSECIRYVDFEPDTVSVRAEDEIAYPVSVVVEAFTRQLVHGRDVVPKVDVFCYGNEVHYYVRYINHPAFVRVDYAPPLSGGMVDLEYYGVSKHELSLHPNVELGAIRQFFRALEFDVQIKDTRIHARFDKERALDFGDLCRKVEALFNLVPYLMEVDWVVGYLSLSERAKRAVANAWADFFVRWYVLPVWRILTEDRQGIRLASPDHLDEGAEIPWDGRGEYRDLFGVDESLPVIDTIRRWLADRGLDFMPLPNQEDDTAYGQVSIERVLLRPLREAVLRGEVVLSAKGPILAVRGVFEGIAESERFAVILHNKGQVLEDACRLARVVTALERNLRFQTKGTVNGYEVQRANVVLRGQTVKLYVLRDSGGIARLAMYATGGRLHRRRDREDERWQDSGSCDVARLVALLRVNNYLASGLDPQVAVTDEQIESVLACFSVTNPSRMPHPVVGDRVLRGMAASPGQAVGTVKFGTDGRLPDEFEGAVLVSPTVRPEDVAYICRAAGVVSTGGGVLSHAGLLAVQFAKPAMIIPGRWNEGHDGSRSVVYWAIEYEEVEQQVSGYVVTTRRDVREKEERIREGDLVFFDADSGLLRILGQDRDVLSLHDGLRQLAEVGERLARVVNDSELLLLRGRRLHALHQVERLLSRLGSAVLARHAVQRLLLESSGSGGGSADDRSRLLGALLNNDVVANEAVECIGEIADDLRSRHCGQVKESLRMIPSACDPYEVLALRLKVWSLLQMLLELLDVLPNQQIWDVGTIHRDGERVDQEAAKRLRQIRNATVCELPSETAGPGVSSRLRHAIRQVDRIDAVLGDTASHGQLLEEVRRRLTSEDSDSVHRYSKSRILTSKDGGLEMHDQMGWKAANLAEVSRLGASGLVPNWFVVTDYAFREMLDTPVDRRVDALAITGMTAPTLGEAISFVLSDEHVTDSVKSARIANLWESAHVSREMTEELAAAYEALGWGSDRDIGSDDCSSGSRERVWGVTKPEEDGSNPFVAVRSSSLEEDTEIAARAGEFDTYLFISGIETLLRHLRRAWSGLWTERAIHNRRIMGIDLSEAGGGVVVQRIAWSRVAGVMQTINLADGRMQEMVINAGLGLGEGIVSGRVAADQILVAKDMVSEDAPLRFRYLTADKREQIVFDKRNGIGTVAVETLYHQRLRPALEYVELCELVRQVRQLECAYGYPLDVEFGIEGTSLRLLQVRPVADFGSVFRKTIEHLPLTSGK